MRVLLLAILTLAVAGCVPVSLDPLYSAGDTLFDPELVGVWQDDAGGNWQFIGRLASTHTQYDSQYDSQYRGGDAQPPLVPVEPEFDGYIVIYTPQGGEPASFVGHLTRIGGVTFLDISPGKTLPPAASGNVLESALHIPAHAWLKLERSEGQLDLRPVSLDWFKAVEPAIPHRYYDEHCALITCGTEELREFIAAHMHKNGFFKSMESLLTQGTRSSAQSGAGMQYDSHYRGNTTSTRGVYEQKSSQE